MTNSIEGSSKNPPLNLSEITDMKVVTSWGPREVIIKVGDKEEKIKMKTLIETLKQELKNLKGQEKLTTDETRQFKKIAYQISDLESNSRHPVLVFLKNVGLSNSYNNRNADFQEIEKERPRPETKTGKSEYTSLSLNKKSSWTNLWLKSDIVTVTKTNALGTETITKQYRVDKKLGSGGMGTANLLKPIDKEGNLIAGKFKVLKTPHDEDAKNIASSGNDTMKGQYVNDKGEPSSIPGFMKTKFFDPTSKVALMTLYEMGDLESVQIDTADEAFKMMGQTLFGLNHMHSSVGGKESLAHGDVKRGNIMHRINGKGESEYGLGDFDGVYKPGVKPQPGERLFTDPYVHQNDYQAAKFGGYRDSAVQDKKRDVYALGLSWRESIAQTHFMLILNIDGPMTMFQDGYLIRKPMSTDDIPGFQNFTDNDKAKMEAVVILINQMTDSDYRRRPTTEQGLSFLKGQGIPIPNYPESIV